MKKIYLLLLTTAFTFTCIGQLDSVGASHVDFGVDADTKVGFQKIKPIGIDSTYHHGDWFLNTPYNGKGQGVIDTTGASYYRSLLMANQNISFTKRMSKAPFDVVYFYKPDSTGPTGARFWVDGLYFRDNAVGNDSTSFTGSKNGDNPNNWTGAISQVGDKVDIVDAYTHVRTSGTRPTIDSVWFFAGVSTVGTSGARYFDIEVYRESISYNPTTKSFTSAGTSGGHTMWTFDAMGKVTQTGDIIISVNYQSGRAPEIDFRIWVSTTAYNTITPQAFKFSNKFDANSAGTAGYAKITPNSGNTNWGTGVSNYTTSSAVTDSTYSTPWGTLNTSKTWSQNYDKLQLVEIALNFSRFGMNPFQYVTSFCKSPYSSVLFKSRTAPEFNSSLSDFVSPQEFTVKNLATFSTKTDTITCNDPVGVVKLTASARNYYRWFNMNGDTLSKDSDTLSFRVPKSGQYIIEATNFQGCLTLGKRDTITVALDSIPPAAKVLLGWDRPYYFLKGGDTSASNALTPFGRSAGLSFNYTGPNGFSSTEQNPTIDTTNDGKYYLQLSETRNGCKAMDSIYLSAGAFVLRQTNIVLNSQTQPDGIRLSWKVLEGSHYFSYEVQRNLDGGLNYNTINSQQGTPAKNLYIFVDREHYSVNSIYRILARQANGTYNFSNMLFVSPNKPEKIFVCTRSMNRITAQIQSSIALGLSIIVMDLNGRILHRSEIEPGATASIDPSTAKVFIPLPQSYEFLPVIVSLYRKNQLIASRKL